MRRSLLLVAAVLCAVPSFAAPQGGNVLGHAVTEGQSTAAYWTSERLASAKPFDLAPMISADAAEVTADAAVDESLAGEVISSPGAPPSRRGVPSLRRQIVDPSALASFMNETGEAIEGENVGTQAAHFTSSRLIPLSADTTYPYATVGRLFFSDGPTNYVCSASVLRQRIILTAGHCVHKGSGGQSGFFSNFLFVPAYRDGAAPFGTWAAVYIYVTNTWATGNAVFPNSQDFATIEVDDKNGLKIGKSYTGFLGYIINKLHPNHATLVGYPVNLDNGTKMHQVTAGSKGPYGNNTNSVIYGADMRGGASGGPWIQNFGAVATGQTAGTNKLLNAVIGVTSYGPVATTSLFLGSSIPDNRFVQLINAACARRAGNCS
jgi:V8-like Glu-specific endopeptidase